MAESGHKDPSGVSAKDRDFIHARPEPADQPGAGKVIQDQVTEGRKQQQEAEARRKADEADAAKMRKQQAADPAFAPTDGQSGRPGTDPVNRDAPAPAPGTTGPSAPNPNDKANKAGTANK
jgi:hypothetical protein